MTIYINYPILIISYWFLHIWIVLGWWKTGICGSWRIVCGKSWSGWCWRIYSCWFFITTSCWRISINFWLWFRSPPQPVPVSFSGGLGVFRLFSNKGPLACCWSFIFILEEEESLLELPSLMVLSCVTFLFLFPFNFFLASFTVWVWVHVVPLICMYRIYSQDQGIFKDFLHIGGLKYLPSFWHPLTFSSPWDRSFGTFWNGHIYSLFQKCQTDTYC